MMANLIEHLESRLGEIQHGWTKDIAGNPMPFQVAEFRNGKLSGVVTFATVGLSEYEILSPMSNVDTIRHELLVSVQEEHAEGRPYVPVLQQTGIRALDDDAAVLRGDVIGPMGPVTSGSPLEAFYAAIPVYFDDDFAALESDRGYSVAIGWLAPISKTEAEFVRDQGWEAFEERLVEHDPNLLDPFREGLSL